MSLNESNKSSAFNPCVISPSPRTSKPMFVGLRSRKMIECECRYFMAAEIWRARDAVER